MERDLLLKLWGKSKTHADGTVTYHPLLYHLLDVAAVAREMWQHTRQEHKAITGYLEFVLPEGEEYTSQRGRGGACELQPA